MAPLIQDYSIGIDNPNEMLKNEEQKQEDIASNDKAKGKTPAMQKGVMDTFNMGEYNESDNDKIDEILKLEQQDSDNDLEGLFEEGNIINENQEQNENEVSFQEKENSVLENKYYPKISQLYENGDISPLEYKQVIDVLYSGDKIDLSTLEFTNKDSVEEIVKKIDKTEINAVENRDDMYIDFKDMKDIDDFGVQVEAFDLIGKNYIKSGNENDGEQVNKELNLSSAIKQAYNIDLKGKQNTPVESETFKQAYLDIFSNDLERQKEGFETMYLLVFSNEGISAKAMDKGKISIIEAQNKKLVLLKERYFETQDLIKVAQENGDNIKLIELEETLDSINKQGDEVSKGDIFESGTIDKVNDKVNEIPTENK